MPTSTPKNFMAIVTAAGLALAVALSSPPPLAAADKKVSTSLEGFRIIKVAPGLATGDKVIDLLLPYIGNHPESLEGRPTLDLTIRRHEDTLVADLVLGGYLDDSVSGEHYRGFIISTQKGWELLDLGVKHVCYRGKPGKSGKCP